MYVLYNTNLIVVTLKLSSFPGKCFSVLILVTLFLILLLLDMEKDYSRIRVYERNMTTSQFMNLCSLCNDRALLGQHLLSMAKSLSGSENPSENCKTT